MSVSSLQEMLARAGVSVSRKKLNKLTPHESSLAEKWAVEKVQPGTFPGVKMPIWLKAFTTRA